MIFYILGVLLGVLENPRGICILEGMLINASSFEESTWTAAAGSPPFLTKIRLWASTQCLASSLPRTDCPLLPLLPHRPLLILSHLFLQLTLLTLSDYPTKTSLSAGTNSNRLFPYPSLPPWLCSTFKSYWILLAPWNSLLIPWPCDALVPSGPSVLITSGHPPGLQVTDGPWCSSPQFSSVA